jgi:hypothetical protein
MLQGMGIKIAVFLVTFMVRSTYFGVLLGNYKVMNIARRLATGCFIFKIIVEWTGRLEVFDA